MKHQIILSAIISLLLSIVSALVSTNGIISTVAGVGVYNGDDIQATSAALNYPFNLFVTSDNTVYLTDTNNLRVRAISSNGIISTVAGTGVAEYSGDNGQATSATLHDSYGIFITSDNTIYIADTFGNRIRAISPVGIITTVAGTGLEGYNGDNMQATSATLNYPYSVMVASDNTVYIADSYNNRIRKISPNGIITTVAGTGVAGYSGDNGPATSARVDCPFGVYLTTNNVLYIADYNNNRIRKVSSNGIISTIAGTGVAGYFGDDGDATSARLNYPTGILVTSDSSVYVADSYNHRIRKISPTGIITNYIQ
jgi:hypothetical protein